MRLNGFDGMACSIASVMGALGDRWGALIMRDLLIGLSRYDDLRRSSGITNATLSSRLKLLELNGLIERRQYQSAPARHEYLPTNKGRELTLMMHAMREVGDRWNSSEPGGRPMRLVNRLSGHDLKLVLVDQESGERVHSADVSIQPGPSADDLMQWRLQKLTKT